MNIPAQLQHLAGDPVWVAWRYEPGKNGRPTKVPYRDNSLKATVQNPAHLLPEMLVPINGMDGKGIAFLPERGLRGCDLDACLDDDGNLRAWARRIVDRLDSYTEISPSGVGVKVFIEAPRVFEGDRKSVKWPSGREKDHEIAYYQGGYFTVTGRVFLDRPVRKIDAATVRWVLDEIERHRKASSTPQVVPDSTDSTSVSSQAQATPYEAMRADLRRLIEDGVDEGERSEAFHHAVCWLGDLGWSAEQIVGLLEQHPDGIAEKYIGRLDGEVRRCLGKRKAEKPANKADASSTMVFDLRSFMAEMRDLHFVWRLVLRKGWLYALTANPGAGKTAIALYLTLMLALGKAIHGKETMPCRVLYLCGENPDDVRMRFALLMDRHGLNLVDLDGRVYFTKRPFAIDQKAVREAFIANAARHGPFDFCVIDTGPAHSSLDDENDNRAMHDLAIAMREAAEQIGEPCTLALMHPVKNASRDNLLPRGGSSFSGSIDGVLCAWRDGDAPVELFPHPDKFRGEHFRPMHFRLETVEHPTIRDNFGHPARTVIATEAEAPTDPSIAAEFDALIPGMDLDVLRMVKRIEEDGDWVGLSQSGTTANNLWRHRNHTAFPLHLAHAHMKGSVLRMVEELIGRGLLVKERRMPGNKISHGRERDKVEGVWVTTEGHAIIAKGGDDAVSV